MALSLLAERDSYLCDLMHLLTLSLVYSSHYLAVILDDFITTVQSPGASQTSFIIYVVSKQLYS